MATLLRFCTGVVCAPMPCHTADRLRLPLMVPHNTDPYRTAFTVSVDAAAGTSTGISASDRASTVRALADARSVAADFSAPGHVFPLVAKRGGVLARGGHTEAGVDLCTLAGLPPVAYLCELCHTDAFVAATSAPSAHSAPAPAPAPSAADDAAAAGKRDDGGEVAGAWGAAGAAAAGTYEMLRMPSLARLAAVLRLPLLTIADLQRYRLRREAVVTAVGHSHTPATAPDAGGSAGCAVLRFASLHHDTAYDAEVEWRRMPQLQGGGGGGDAAAPASYRPPLLHVRLNGLDGRPARARDDDVTWATAAMRGAGGEAATAVGGSAVTTEALALVVTGVRVTVTGEVRESVRGRAAAQATGHSQTPPAEARAAKRATAYAADYPMPAVVVAAVAQAAKSAAVGGGDDPGGVMAVAAASHPWVDGVELCDRAVAELAQVVASSIAAVTRGSVVPVPAPAIGAGAHAPAVTLVVPGGGGDNGALAAALLRELRVWEYGVGVAAVAWTAAV